MAQIGLKILQMILVRVSGLKNGKLAMLERGTCVQF